MPNLEKCPACGNRISERITERGVITDPVATHKPCGCRIELEIPTESAMTENVRTVKVGGAVYIRAEDVAKLIREFGSTEETDVRSRAEELAVNVERLARNDKQG